MKKAYIETFGCQMNEHDSARMADIFTREGYEMTTEINQANLAIVNTCSVRENPENKVYSLLGRWRAVKNKSDEELIIGVAGCVAQQAGERILKREKAVDMVFGTDCLFQLPQMLQKVREGERVCNTAWAPREGKVQNFIPDDELEKGHIEGCKASIAIMKGCNNFCTYCIVPYTRGREVSRELDNILQEARDLITKGAKEITLLGQNVNSYMANGKSFYDLLDALSQLEGIERIRFISPHPKDWDNNLADLMNQRKNICNQLHLPFQAGSSRVLKAMRRGHTIEEYLEKIKHLKERVSNVAISTDLIVGFPGETDEDFEGTMKVLEEVRFSQVFAFKYSPRPGTKAEKIGDTVPLEVKEKRLQRVLELHNKVQTELLDEHINNTYEILIDGAHPKIRHAMNGKTDGHFAVTILNSDLEIGDIVKVKITERKAHSLIAELIK